MINKENGFDLNIRWRFPGGREYAFAFIALFTFLIVIYGNSFQGQFVFDDRPNIIDNKNIFLKSLDWSDIEKTFYGIQGKRLNRPFAYFSFALNYYFDGLNIRGYHVVNFLIHYISTVFLFLFIYNTLTLPSIRERYGPASYSIALLSTLFWATSPMQTTAVTYIVQRMASMAGLFYIMAMYFYLKGRTATEQVRQVGFFTGALLCALLSFATKENAVLLPVSIWLYDLLLIQSATRENIIKNLKMFAPVILIVAAIGLWYVDISSIFSGAAYKDRPFTLMERLLTQPRVIIFYITLLLYPIGSRLMLLHDVELSKSLITPWSTLPAIAVIVTLLIFAAFIARKRPLISFCLFFFFMNHLIEGSFLPLDLIYEHRNYIPSMFFFVPLVIYMLLIINYFSYKKIIQFVMVAVFTFLLSAQGHTVLMRNSLFTDPLLLWTDNVEKTPKLSRPHNSLGTEYMKLGLLDKAYEYFYKALSLDRYEHFSNRNVNLHNLGMFHFRMGNYDKAIDHFKSVVKSFPGFWPSYQYAAECFIRKGDMDKAGKILQESLLSWPGNADLRYTMGFVLLKEGNYDQAAKEARRTLSINPDMFAALRILGETSRIKGNFKQAIFYWKRYVEARPNDLEGNFALIELYSHQNNKEELARVIGRLAFLKGSKGWRGLIEQYVMNSTSYAYMPDHEKLIAIIRENIDDQFWY